MRLVPMALAVSGGLLPLAGCRTAAEGKPDGAAVDTAGLTAAADVDGDGYPADEDCDDADAGVNAGAVEVCDGIDNDCDGQVDEDVKDAFYDDADGDGYGDPAASVEACSAPEGTVTSATDCDDANPAVYPSALEICDDLDNDCDGDIDEDDAITWYRDADGDGYGVSDDALIDCIPPDGYIETPGDCDDANASVHPRATEVCNGVDDNCDGRTDEDLQSVYYVDADGDGYGASDATDVACEAPPGFVENVDDCDDNDAAVYPGASEVCNRIDDDCDGLVDDADADVDVATGGIWYGDADADGYGDAASRFSACEQPAGTVADASDCNDASAVVNPGAQETCNGVDDDCDSLVDDDDGSLDASTGGTWYADADSDGYGGGTTITACNQPAGSLSTSTDCNDGDAAVNPAASEVCNGYDDDCDGLVDDDDSTLDASTASTWYVDGDLDGYGDATGMISACAEPSGYTSDDADCDDGDADINPAATETCNGYDDDCDDVADDAGDCPCAVEYRGSNLSHPYMFCTSGASWSAGSSVCNSHGYELLTVNDSSENAWADSTADGYSTQKWWIGLNDRAREGTFVWASGESVTFTNWHSGEPNNGGGNEDCTQFNRFHPSQTWNDEPCGTSFRYICEAW